MNSLVRLLVLAALLVTAPLFAQTGGVTGTVAGRVVDATTRLALGGARVTVPGTTLETFTSATGDYVLVNVPAGVQTLAFGYVGYPEVTQTVTVASRVSNLDVAFGRDLVKLDTLVIAGDAVGQARAINAQRAAGTLTNIVASDELGRFPDQNVAESLQRIPGLALYRDQGEGRFIVVRGIRPDLNSVKLNGVSMASPERGDRTIALDVLPTDTLAAVEVTKVPTPDIDGDGLGGAINLRTRSAFDVQGRQIQFTAQGQYNNLRDRFSSKFYGTFSDTFNNGTIGVIFSPTWQERRLGSNNFEEAGGWSLRPVPGSTTGQQAWFFNEFAFREYELTRHRYGASGAIEFKPDRGTHFYLRGTYTRFIDKENRYVLDLPFSEGTLTALTDTSATVTGVRRERHDLRFREKDQTVYAIVAGGEKTLGAWKFDGRAAYSRGDEKRPAETTVRFRKSARGTNWSYSFGNGTYAPALTVTGGNISDPAAYNEVSRFRVVSSPGEETEFNVGGNARFNFTLAERNPAFVKFGAQLRQKEKIQTGETTDFAVPASFTFASVAEPQTGGDYAFFSSGLRASTPKIQAAVAANPSAFVPTRLFLESEQADWNTDEDVFALYGMGGVTLGATNLMGGVRYERTEFNSTGNEISNSSTVRRSSRGRDYDHFLPGLYLRHDLSRKTVLRASFSNTVARPSYDDSAFTRSINTTTNRVTEGNPGLKPLESMNWDASIEHYLPTLGLVSAAVFKKQIENFTYQRVIPGGDPATGYELTTFVNGDKGEITGLELAWQQQLRFLPAPFDGLGFMANYTWTDSEAKYPSRPGEKIDFIGQSDEIGNVALTYEKRGFFIRLALNFRSARLREDEPIGVDATTDRWVDDTAQLDLTASYKLGKNWEIYGEALNLTNEPFRVYFGKKGTRFTQFEEYGWSANFGVRWKL